ncbi:MAG TPA: hypothetical protein VMT68_09330 [Caulobacteraceae bacterium]|nr:hypothetical protein [Caulobacteraceae bacterium]
MAESSGCAVRDLLPPSFRRMDEAMDRAQREDPEFKTKVLPGMALGVAGERASQAVRGVLDTDVFELIAGAWAKALELRRAADEADKSPDKTATVFLGEHELTAEVHPIAEITFGALGKLTLRFTLEFAAKLELAEVTITDHRIVKIGRSEGQGSAVLKYGDVELHEPLKSRKIALHEDMLLKRPIDIPFSG